MTAERREANHLHTSREPAQGHEDACRQPTNASAAKKPPLKPDLTIVQTQVFRGPNYWSYEPCIRMLVDLGSPRALAVEHDPAASTRSC